MVSTMKIVFATAIIASVVFSAYAINCYSCDSSSDPKCGEKFESQDRFKSDCSQLVSRIPQIGQYLGRNATGCMKRLFSYGPGQNRIERSCFFGDVSHPAIGCQPDLTQITQKVLSCDVCSGNLCNGSSALAPIGFAIALFVALARLLA